MDMLSVGFGCIQLIGNVLCDFWRVVGSGNRKSLCLWLNLSDAEGRSYWEVGARATEGGMLSCFNLCQCPSVWRWCEFRAQCVTLYLAIDPADRSCRRPSEGLGFSFKCVCVRVWGLINVVAIPFCPIRVAPLEGRLAGRPTLHCCSLQTVSAVACHFASVYVLWV